MALAGEVAFTVLAAPLLRTLSPMGLTTRASGLAAVLLAAAALVDGPGALVRPGAGEVLAVAYLAVGSTALAFVCWYRAVAHLGPERTGLFSGLMPVSAALAGPVVAAASLQAGTLAGTALVGAGLAVGLRPPRPLGPARGSRRQDASAVSRAVPGEGDRGDGPASGTRAAPAPADRLPVDGDRRPPPGPAAQRPAGR